MFHKLVWNIELILHKILLTITYNTQTTINYCKLTTTITKYFWIYLHPEVIIIVIASIGVGAHVTGRHFGGAWLR
jgi:hypothetical protein